MNLLYRIYTEYTEDKAMEKAYARVSENFAGFTIIRSTGFWAGVKEDSVIIEIITSDKDKKGTNTDILAICSDIAEMNDQEAVLFTCSKVSSVIKTAQGFSKTLSR